MHVMKAVRFHEYGGPEVLRLEEVPRPEPAEGRLLVRVRAAGVNPFDAKVRSGAARAWIRHRLPLIPGWDFSGVVERSGPGAPAWTAGAEVLGKADVARDGADAEYLVVAPEEVVARPAGLPALEAAALPTALTAWQALYGLPPGRPGLDLAPGQTILIQGGAGGVGGFAVQLAKLRGARVIATASAAHREHVRALGADVVVDYARERFEEAARDVDAVLDLVGGETLERSWNVLRAGGALASAVGSLSEERARALGARAVAVDTRMDSGQLEELVRLATSGHLRIPLAAVWPLAEVRRAHEAIETGHTAGKIVLRVDA